METSRKIIGKKVTEAREEQRLSITDLANKSEISRITISKIENGTSENPSLDTVSTIAWVLKKPIDFFYNSNMLSLSRTTIPSYRSYASKTSKDNLVTQVKLNRYMLFVEYLYKFINPRELKISSSLLDKAGNLNSRCKASEIDIEAIALQLRNEWNLGDNPISELATLLENKGIICCPTCLPNKIDSINVSFGTGDGKETSIILNNNEQNYFRQRFSLAHELGHIIMHHYWTENDFRDYKDKAEYQANIFASSFLMPTKSFISTFTYPTYNALKALRSIWHVSLSAACKRLYDLRLITDNQYKYLYIEISRRKNGNKHEEPDCISIMPEQPYYLNNAYSFAFNNGLTTPSQVEKFFSLDKRDIVEYINNRDKFINIEPHNQFEYRFTKK